MSGYEIKVILPHDRRKVGEVRLYSDEGELVIGPIPVLGRADQNTATSHGNPSRNPLEQFGDTPTGSYNIANIFNSAEGSRLGDTRSASGRLSYGREGVFLLDPHSGPARVAEASGGRKHLMLHSGDLSSAGELRPTAGCLRVAPGMITALREGIAAIAANSNSNTAPMCRIVDGVVSVQHPVATSTDDQFIDPPPISLFGISSDELHGSSADTEDLRAIRDAGRSSTNSGDSDGGSTAVSAGDSGFDDAGGYYDRNDDGGYYGGGYDDGGHDDGGYYDGGYDDGGYYDGGDDWGGGGDWDGGGHWDDGGEWDGEWDGGGDWGGGNTIDLG